LEEDLTFLLDFLSDFAISREDWGKRMNAKADLRFFWPTEKNNFRASVSVSCEEINQDPNPKSALQVLACARGITARNRVYWS